MKKFINLPQLASALLLALSILCMPMASAVNSVGGCSNFTPDTVNGTSTTVTCDTTSSYTAISTAGVISSENTTTVGNRVTVDVVNGTTFAINGSTIGLGSSAQVTNNGNLNTSSFYYGYGISAGVNGRSQAGGNTILNDVLGTITTGGTSATGVYISATNASSGSNSITNNGLITTLGSTAYGVRLNSGATGSAVANTIVNNNSISTRNTGSTAILMSTAGGVATVTNASGAAISTTGKSSSGIQLTATGGAATLTNAGMISTSGAGSNGIQIGNGTAAVSIINTGTIDAAGTNSFGIYSAGNITNLTNSQGGSAPLTYSGALPINYNVVVSNVSNYGKLDVGGGNVTGVMNFNINSNSSLTFNHTYSTVLNGLKINNLGNSYGTFTSGSNTYIWALVHRVGGSAAQSDLVIQPAPQSAVPPTIEVLKAELLTQAYLINPINVDTQTSLTSLGNTLQGLFAMQTAGVVNSMTYDCPLFGNNNICLSTGGRFTNVSVYPNNSTSALLIGAYRLSPSWRLGGYLDQNITQSTPGGIAQLNNSSPMVGVFGVWSQSPDGSGVEAKISAAYVNKGATLTRPVIGVAEAGSGSTNLTAQGIQGVLKYGFPIGNKTLISPYAGMRYMAGGMGGYSEAQTGTVSSPLTYNAIGNYTTTTLAGFIANHRLTEKTMLVASAGAEKDVNANVGNLITTGNGDYNIAINNNYRSLRPTASLGAFYDLSTRERLGLVGIYRQEAYQAMTSSTILATYTVGL
ncbi:autotransporter domain-containing protein [Polynucleobacter sp. VK25]|uniref:beta strand repeat-containing protein n=1 Tax=Polynucleobacter sp. VK25 TaxID=1758398 RepID=UPI001BFD1ED2|nr:autotransporter domain-containing protein [Polynucleobacter sp. VK25]QWD68748.1 autotransporter domain-containing protein [Polynucleobacter sp. VK25]